LNNAEKELREIVTAHPDATLVEFCKLFAHRTGNWVVKPQCVARYRSWDEIVKKRSGVAKQGQKE
jgi:hypothetical protein